MTIEDAIIFATERHRGQTDKAGAPYILHPIRVALRMPSVEGQLAALLHDVIEDTGVTADELRRHGLPEPVVETVALLTKTKGDSYETFVGRIAGHPLARAVKLADIADNLDPARLALLPPEAQDTLRAKYDRARALLGA